MKTINFKLHAMPFVLGAMLIGMTGCERELSDEAVLATLPNTAEIFTDTPVGLGSDFYFPFQGSKATAWTVDNSEGYNSRASMRFDVPNASDPEGNYAGAIFRVDGAGRDLTGYNALTFWAKASRGVTIGEIGFGQDFLENKYQVTKANLDLSTNWVKYIIPIPDASKLFDERGVFWYAAGTQNTGGYGYTFWIDELKFENLGTIGQPQPAIFNGQDIQQNAYSGISLQVNGLTQTFNLGSGVNQTITAAPSYFDFMSSDTSAAVVDEQGVITIIGDGSPIITASLAGVEAEGSMTVNILGDFQLAPTPTRDASNVVSIFSDAYTNVPVDFFNGYWEPFQTTESADFVIDGNNMLGYTNFNFVGNQFANPTVDATSTPNLHLNMYIPGDIPSNLDFLITVRDFGPDKSDGGGDDTFQQIFFNSSNFTPNTWATLEAPLTLPNKNNIGLIIYENVNGSPLKEFYLDNIYFYAN